LDEISKSLIKISDLMVMSDPYVALRLVLIGIFILFFISKMPQSKENESMPSMGFTFAKLRMKKNTCCGDWLKFYVSGLKLYAGPIYINIKKVRV
jgi:FHS family L-fucose permease-like MFS transporter